MSENRVATMVLLDGLEQARLRFARCEPGTAEAFHAIFEALAWIGASHNRLVADGLDRPAILDGLYYMRNVVIHQGVDVLSWLLFPGSGKLGAASLGAFKLGGSGPSLEWRWPLVGECKSPESPTGTDEYRTMIAGSSVAATLNDAVTALRSVRGLSGDASEEAGI